MRKIMIMLLTLMMAISIVSASGVTTDRLNWYGSEQHTVFVTNTEGTTEDAVLTMPTGFSFVSSVDGCTNPGGQTINCSAIPDDDTYEFIMSSPVSGTEYELLVLSGTIGSETLNNVSFINIQDHEIFHTLVEYGRGRGNYFYNSMGSTTSAGTGIGYRWLPVDTDYELNYLHKVFNIKQYYGLATSRATDVSFSCEYPVHTVVRQHLTTSIEKDLDKWTVSYSIPRIDGSWERMGFLGMGVNSGEYNIGENMSINCSSLSYTIEDAYGDIMVDSDSFYLQIRGIEPVGMSATATPTTIGNGTSEVLIMYTFTNNELYPMDKVVVEIEAPELAQFIGVRGELWGTSQNRYRYELTEIAPGQSEEITLVARFDTSSSADTSLLLTQGVKIQFFPTWELNAYNPLSMIQTLSPVDNLTVNYGVSSSITSVQAQLNSIQNTVNNIEIIVTTINTTVNDIDTLVNQIENTVGGLESYLISINNTVGDINDSNNEILVLVQSINTSLASLDVTEILTELSYMQSFNEELIFLVTDSVGLATEAKKDFEKGDLEGAKEKLIESSDNLKLVDMEVNDYKKVIEHKYKMKNEKNVFKKISLWIEGLFIPNPNNYKIMEG